MTRKKKEEIVEQVQTEDVNGSELAELDFVTGSDFEVEDTPVVVPPPVVDPEETIPLMSDIQWNNYVLSHFDKNELVKGRPTAAGLQRIIRLLFGPILVMKSDTKQFPTLDNGQRATVEYTVKIRKIDHLQPGEEYGEIIECTDGADAWHGNITGEEFAQHPVAVCTTKSWARALRKVLGLAVAAAEEMTEQSPAESAFDGKITEGQITKLDIKCEQLNINLMKLITAGNQFKGIKDIPFRKVHDIFALLSEYQRGAKQIPEKFKGYNPGWRD